MTPFVAQAQQRQETVVTILSEDSATIEARRVATKDLILELKSRSSGTGPAPIIVIKNCGKVPAVTIQNLAKELMAQKFVVAIDERPPASGLCSP
jgi:hypothetical protein